MTDERIIMIKGRNVAYRRNKAFIRAAAVLLAMLFTVMLASPEFAYAAKEKTPEPPIREVHNVGVGSGAYCFFVTHNVVLTAAEVAEMTDEELTAHILDKAGLYMMKANCRKPKNDKIISVKSWEKKDGAFFLSEADIESIRTAEPVDGDPVKIYMDLIICEDINEYKSKDTGEDTGDDTNDGDTEEQELTLYSTFKRNEPKLLFAVVATEADAAFGEDICKEDPPKKTKIKNPTTSPGKSPAVEKEILPEYRTISMVDRSGEPIEETLKDGEPVELEWIEPKHNSGTEEEPSFIDRVPGGITGIVLIGAAAVAAVVAAAVLAGKRKQEDW